MIDGKWSVLVGALLIFPQIVETIYSPALPGIAGAFNVSAEIAAQTLSIYFVAFAVGVLVWGWLCDVWGRRPAMLAGLTLYVIASVVALLVSGFGGLLAARIMAAFGAAVGSVVTQTVMRDRLDGVALARFFSLIGLGLATSPALGLLAGTSLVGAFGYRGVFATLLVLGLLLLTAAALALPETRPTVLTAASLRVTARRMAEDPNIWQAVLLVALFNVSLFSFYTLAPFQIARATLEPTMLAWGGVALALGSLAGAQLNSALLKRSVKSRHLLLAGALVNLVGSGLVLGFQDSWLFLPCMSLISFAFALAVPVVLAEALVDYADCRGRAGALLGLAYYLLIGSGLALAGWGQDLGLVLTVCAVSAFVVVLARVKAAAPVR